MRTAKQSKRRSAWVRKRRVVRAIMQAEAWLKTEPGSFGDYMRVVFPLRPFPKVYP